MTKSSLIASVALLLAMAAAEPAVAIRIGGDLGKIIKKGEDTIKDAGKGAETIVKNAGKETERAAKDVGNGLKRLPEEAEKTVKNLKKAVPKEVRNAVDKTYKGAVAVTVGSVVATSVVPLQASSEAGKALLGKQSFSDAWNKSSAAAKESIATQAAGTSMMVQGAAGVGEAGNAAIEHIAGEICDECKDAATAYLAPQRFTAALGVTAAEYGRIVAERGDPSMLLAAPLATALRQAYDTHIANARPIPASAMARLKTYYSQEFLDQIRYSVGKVTNLTIPDALGGGHKVFGHELGVTIQNLIIFTTEPGDDIWWWAHELQHVQQYAELESIEAFAWAYIKHYKSLERDADDAANKVVRALDARDKPSDDPSIPTIAVPVESDLVSVTFRNILSTGGWTMKVCAKPSREGTDPIDAQVLGIKFVERGGSTDCAVAWLSDAEAPVVSEIIEINTIDPSACEATFKSVFADISMIGWQCSNPSQVNASNPQ